MADMYDRFRRMAIRNLAPRSAGGNGTEATLLRKTRTYNPTTDMNEEVVTSITTSGIRASYKQRHIDGQMIRQGDVKFYLSPVQADQSTATPTPLTTDQLEVLGNTYFIISVKTWNHAGTECGWMLQLRAA